MKTRTLVLLLTLLALLTVALAVLGLCWMIRDDRAPALSSTTGSQTHFTQPFHLTDQNGHPVTQTTMLGKPSLYFFGFTHCPDICPTTLGALTNWLNTLGADADKLNVLFVSIDPERDSPATLKAYLASFHPHIQGATGTLEDLRTMAKQFMVYYAKVPVQPGENPANYMMSHSSGILMADKDGTFMGMLDAHDSDAEALTKLKALLK